MMIKECYKTSLFAVLLLMSACINGSNGMKSLNEEEQSTSSENDSLSNITKYTYTDSAGVVYPIYLTADSLAYIIQVSEETGEKKHIFLPKITEQLRQK